MEQVKSPKAGIFDLLQGVNGGIPEPPPPYFESENKRPSKQCFSVSCLLVVLLIVVVAACVVHYEVGRASSEARFFSVLEHNGNLTAQLNASEADKSKYLEKLSETSDYLARVLFNVTSLERKLQESHGMIAGLKDDLRNSEDEVRNLTGSLEESLLEIETLKMKVEEKHEEKKKIEALLQKAKSSETELLKFIDLTQQSQTKTMSSATTSPGAAWTIAGTSIMILFIAFCSETR